MPSLDVWDEFIEEISHQSRSAQPEILDVKYKFDLDLLPVNFGSYLETTEEGRIDRTALNNAIKQLAEIIWENSGFRFRLNEISSMPHLTHSFTCCQDVSRKNNLVPDEERDRRRMATFECNSKLAMTPSLENLLQQQVYHQWKQQNKRFWKHDDDQFTSSKILLEKLGDSYRCEIFHEENINALTIYINASIDVLKRTTAEVAIDATYGTNNAGMDLYAVLAELDGTGVPMAYLFVKKDRLTWTAPTGAITQILVKFLRPL
ncbi:hypothetical protein K3495_g14752 [Podosphaera aphanis]|nr:hypothetical protein K3495_g14752 [Podosphaera aphanis]